MKKKLSNYIKKASAAFEQHLTAFALAKPVLSKMLTAGKLYALDTADETKGQLYIYKSIGDSWWSDGVTAESVRDALALMPKVKTLDVFINSPGGDVFEGKAIFTQLKRFASENKAEVVMHIDGIAASAASFIAMAGTRIITSSVATWMVHNAWTWAAGNADDMQATVDLLRLIDGDIAQMYAHQTGRPVEEMRELMKAETWMTAAEALEKGFTDEVEDYEEKTDDEEKDEEPAPADSKAANLAALAVRVDALMLSQDVAAALLKSGQKK